MKIFVTGIGIVSAIGVGIDENFKSIKSGVTGIGRSAEFENSSTSLPRHRKRGRQEQQVI